MMVEEGNEREGQVSVFFKGEVVVDIAGGRRRSGDDDDQLTPEHIGPIFSCTKVATSIVMSILADRGLIDLGRTVQ